MTTLRGREAENRERFHLIAVRCTQRKEQAGMSAKRETDL